VTRADEYRCKAVECLESARLIADAGPKNGLIDMALHWLRLADLSVTNYAGSEQLIEKDGSPA
jgi:hypothetical protein